MYSKGISWFDDCRIPFVDDKENTKRSVSGHQKIYGSGEEIYYKLDIDNQEDRNKGRFPANLLVCDDMLNDGNIYKSGEGKPHHKRNKTLGEYQGNAYGKFNNINPQLNYENYYGDKGTNSRYYDIDKWFDKIINYE